MWISLLVEFTHCNLTNMNTQHENGVIALSIRIPKHIALIRVTSMSRESEVYNKREHNARNCT